MASARPFWDYVFGTARKAGDDRPRPTQTQP